MQAPPNSGALQRATAIVSMRGTCRLAHQYNMQALVGHGSAAWWIADGRVGSAEPAEATLAPHPHGVGQCGLELGFQFEQLSCQPVAACLQLCQVPFSLLILRAATRTLESQLGASSAVAAHVAMQLIGQCRQACGICNTCADTRNASQHTRQPHPRLRGLPHGREDLSHQLPRLSDEPRLHFVQRQRF